MTDIDFTTCLDKNGRYKQTKKHHKLFFDKIRDGDLAFVTKVLDASPEMVNVLGADNALYRDKSPLMYAIQLERADICDLLIDRGADVTFVMPGGKEMPLCNMAATVSAHMGNKKDGLPRILSRILELGADPNLTDDMGRDAMYEAVGQLRALSKHYQTLQILIEGGADPERRHRERVRELAELKSDAKLPDVVLRFYELT